MVREQNSDKNSACLPYERKENGKRKKEVNIFIQYYISPFSFHFVKSENCSLLPNSQHFVSW